MHNSSSLSQIPYSPLVAQKQESMADSDDDVVYDPNSNMEKKSYWRWSKQEMFPEQSFQSWSSYTSALSQTPSRFKDRFLHRSTDSNELSTLAKESENPMKRCLTWWDLIWLSFGSVVGTGVFVLTGQEAHNHAGSSIVLSYAISGLSALCSVFCYTEFAVEIPVAGGSFSYLRIELGDFIAFIAAGNILLEAVVGAAGLARSWTSYFATLINLQPNALRIHVKGFGEGFNQLDPIAVAVLLITSALPMFGTMNASLVNWVTSMLSILVILFVVIAGFVMADTANLSPFFPYGVGGTFKAAAVLFWAYTGFDMVATLAEETKQPSKDIPIGLVGSMLMITVVYCIMALSLSMLQKYTQLDVNAAFSVAFEHVGMKWAKYIVAIGAIKGMTMGLMIGTLGQGRYTTQIARSHMIPPWFARVHPKTGTPINAMLLVSLTAACVALFSSLDVLSSVSSISTLFIFMLMAVALLMRRYYVNGVSSNSDVRKLLLFLFMIIGSSVGTSVYYNLNPNGWIVHAVTVPIWFSGTLGIAVFLPQRRAPKVWGVPFVPWLPSLSIGINLFLMGALGYQAFVRFGICTLVMLVYYALFSLHATYDVAHQKQIDLEAMRVKNDNTVDAASSPLSHSEVLINNSCLELFYGVDRR